MEGGDEGGGGCTLVGGGTAEGHSSGAAEAGVGYVAVPAGREGKERDERGKRPG